MRPRIVNKKGFEKGDESLDNPLIITCVVDSAPNEGASALKKRAFDFISSGEYLKVDLYSDGQPTGSRVVASWFQEKPDDYPANSWIISLAVTDPTIREQVLKGEIDYLSFDPTGANLTPFSRIEMLKSENNDSGTPIDTVKGDDPMTLQQEITDLKQKCEALMRKPIAKDATIEAHLAELHNKIQALAESESATSLEKDEGQKDVVKSFWHDGILVRKVPATKGTVKSKGETHRQSKLKSCGLIANWH
jgi:hypothetical protein